MQVGSAVLAEQSAGGMGCAIWGAKPAGNTREVLRRSLKIKLSQKSDMSDYSKSDFWPRKGLAFDRVGCYVYLNGIHMQGEVGLSSDLPLPPTSQGETKMKKTASPIDELFRQNALGQNWNNLYAAEQLRQTLPSFDEEVKAVTGGSLASRLATQFAREQKIRELTRQLSGKALLSPAGNVAGGAAAVEALGPALKISTSPEKAQAMAAALSKSTAARKAFEANLLAGSALRKTPAEAQAILAKATKVPHFPEDISAQPQDLWSNLPTWAKVTAGAGVAAGTGYAGYKLYKLLEVLKRKREERAEEELAGAALSPKFAHEKTAQFPTNMGLAGNAPALSEIQAAISMPTPGSAPIPRVINFGKAEIPYEEQYLRSPGGSSSTLTNLNAMIPTWAKVTAGGVGGLYLLHLVRKLQKMRELKELEAEVIAQSPELAPKFASERELNKLAFLKGYSEGLSKIAAPYQALPLPSDRKSKASWTAM